MKKNLFVLICLVFSLQTIAKTSVEEGKSFSNEVKLKERMEVWCEVRGVYSTFTGENGVVNYVCSFVSNTSICYYVRCGEWANVGTTQTNIPAGINIEDGSDFIAIPNENGYQITYLNGYSYNVLNNTLTITKN